MKGSTKRQLLFAVGVALTVVLAAWYAATRQTYYQNGALVQIDYTPATGSPPYLTFTFARPLAAGRVAGTSAFLKSFAPTTPAAAGSPAATLLALLIGGPDGKGPVPFVPTLTEANPATVTTNTLPGSGSRPNAPALPTTPVSVRGAGMMWFAVPKKPPG